MKSLTRNVSVRKTDFYGVIEGVAVSRAVGLHVEERENVNGGEDEAEEKLFDPGGAGGSLLEPQPNGHEKPVAEDHRPDEPREGRSEKAQCNNSSR